jgi:catechol 2,3-dioxygenase-like lactoylglutathione lyase family enzyme
MLGSTNIIAFVATKDAEKAKAFYVDVLGLRFIKDDGFDLPPAFVHVRIRQVTTALSPV